MADKILLIVRKKSSHPHSVKSISKQLSQSESNIYQSAEILEQWGYKLKVSRKNKTVQLLSLPDIISATEISYNLKTRVIGHTIFSYNSVKSTNDLAHSLAEQQAAEGTIITAEEQTKGRGRLGRLWHSPPHSGIYLSIILRPKFSPHQAPGISIMTALALTETLDKFLPGKVKIKWPNDILINGKKTAGILTELSAEKNKINYLVVGIGINVNQPAGVFPEDIKDKATSVRKALRRKTDRVQLLQSFLLNFENEYKKYQKSMLKLSLKRIEKFSHLHQKHIRIKSGKEIIDGRVIGFKEDGAIILQQNDNNNIITVSSGEVTIVI